MTKGFKKIAVAMSILAASIGYGDSIVALPLSKIWDTNEVYTAAQVDKKVSEGVGNGGGGALADALADDTVMLMEEWVDPIVADENKCAFPPEIYFTSSMFGMTSNNYVRSFTVVTASSPEYLPLVPVWCELRDTNDTVLATSLKEVCTNTSSVVRFTFSKAVSIPNTKSLYKVRFNWEGYQDITQFEINKVFGVRVKVDNNNVGPYMLEYGQTHHNWRPQMTVTYGTGTTIVEFTDATVQDGLSVLNSRITELQFQEWYPDGSVTSEADFTTNLLFDVANKDAVNHTIKVCPFAEGTYTDNSHLVGRIVIPPYVDIDGERYTVNGVAGQVPSGQNENLTSIIAPTTVKTIEAEAFEACGALEEVSFPGVTTIGELAFGDCSSLEALDFPELLEVGEAVFAGCDRAEILNLPKAITMGTDAFYACYGLKVASLPALTNLLGEAFIGCTNLTSVYAPSAIYVERKAFQSCTSLKEIVLDKALEVDQNAFDQCSSLETISLPSVKVLDSYAFRRCSSLKSISMPLVESLTGGSFSQCIALETIALPNAITIGDNAFNGCTNLTSVILPSAQTIGAAAFDNCRALIAIELPNVKSVGVGAFDSCVYLQSASLPLATITSNGIFKFCVALEDVNIPKATLLEDTFKSCTNLKKVSLPNVVEIANPDNGLDYNYTFHGCQNLTLIDFGDTVRSTIPYIGSKTFYNVPTNCVIVVPDSQYAEWTTTNGWENLVAAGYKFYRHSEWEYAHRYELPKVVEYRLPDECFPITYEELIDTTYVERTIADNDGIRFENSGDAIVLHDIASEAAGRYDYGFSSFSASTLKWDSSDAPIGNLKFNNTAPTANTWPILEKDAVYVRDVQVAKEADVAAKLALKANDSEVLKNSGNQTLMGTLKALGAGGLVETLNSSMNEVGVRAYNGSSYAVKYLADGIYVSTDGEATYTKLSLPNVAGTLALVSQIYAAVQQIAPAWVSGTTYAADALVSYNGAIYARRTSGSITSSTNPASDTTNWQAKKVSELFLPLTGGDMQGGITFYSGNLIVRGASRSVIITGVDIEQFYEGSTYNYNLPFASGTLALLQNLAADYSTSTTYALNALCVNSGTLYRCTTAITTAEAWTAAHWTEATVEDVLAAIRTALADKAPLASPAFSGRPTAPNMDAQSTDGQVANKKYVDNSVSGKANTTDLPYDIAAKTITSNAVTVSDRTINKIANPSANFAVVLPTGVSTKSRDFYLAIECDANPPTSIVVTNAILQTANGTSATLTLEANKTNILHFTEIDNGNLAANPPSLPTFLVTGGANDGGSQPIFEPDVDGNRTAFTVGERCPVNDSIYTPITDPDTGEYIEVSGLVGKDSFSAGYMNAATGMCSTAFGVSSAAAGDYSAAFGNSYAAGERSFSQGESAALGYCAHAEGTVSEARGSGSHAEGAWTRAFGNGSHAEGYYADAYGDWSHVEGDHSQSIGTGSHAEGSFTIASNQYEHAEGVYNLTHMQEGLSNPSNTLMSVGCGTSISTRTNAVEVLLGGKTYIKGVGNYNGTNPYDVGVKDLAAAINDKLESPLANQSFDLSLTSDLYSAISNIVEVLGGTITGMPPLN